MRPSTLALALIALLSVLVLAPTNAASQPSDAGPPQPHAGSEVAAPQVTVKLSARVALSRALAKSPELAPGRLVVRDTAALRQLVNRDTFARPVISAEGGVRRNPFGDAHPELSVSVTQEVPLISIGGARHRHADALLKHANAQLEGDSLELAVEVLNVWLDLAHWERVVAYYEQAVERAARSSELVAQQVAFGTAQPGDDAVAESALGRLRATQRRAFVECDRAIGQLQLLLDAGPAQRFVTEGELGLPAPAVADAEVSRHPRTLLLLAEAHEQRSSAELERVQAEPQLGLGARVTREGTGDWLALVQISAPLPLGEPNRYATSAKAREVRALELDAQRTRVRLARLTAQLNQRWAIQRRLVEQREQEELAPARQALRLIEYQFEAAKVPLQTLLVARERVADAEMNLLLERLELERQRLQLAWADGSLLQWARNSR